MKIKFIGLNMFLWISLLTLNCVIAQGTWTRKADFSGEKRHDAVSFSIGSKFYIGKGINVGGQVLKDFWEWDQATNVWTQKSDFPGNLTLGEVSFSIGTKGYIGMGTDSNEFWEYDPLTDTWMQKASLPDTAARAYAVGFSIGTKGYIGTGMKYFIGQDDPYKMYQDFWEWDQETNVWTKKADFAGPPRLHAVGFSIGTKGYIGTGMQYVMDQNIAFVRYKDFWEWDQGTNAWTQKADFKGSDRYGAIGFSIGDKGYIGIGYLGQVTSLNDFWEWDQGTNTWTQKADYIGLGRYGAIGFSIGNKGYAGLRGDFYDMNSDFWEFDPLTIPDTPTDVVPNGSIVNKLSSNQFIFTEGPVWYNDSVLLFVDDGIGTPNIFQYNPVEKQFSKWPTNSPHCTGLTMDKEGNLIGVSSNIVMINNDGQGIKTVASGYNGKAFNNPNDLIANKMGGVYFTDPDFFLSTPPQDKTAVYYIDSIGIVKRVIDDLAKPNGLVLSPDDSKLYVVDTEIKYLYSWTVASDGSLSDKSILAELDTIAGDNNYADGMAMDIHGNIYVATGMGIQIFSPEGFAIATIAVPEQPSNCDFGGKDFKTLFITAHKNLYSIDLNYPGYSVSRKGTSTEVEIPVKSKQSVELYPNPVSNYMYVHHNIDKIYDIEILTLDGKRLPTHLNQDQETRLNINTQELPKGMYLLRIIYSEGTVTRKFIKK